jgi:hypothetical protein
LELNASYAVRYSELFPLLLSGQLGAAEEGSGSSGSGEDEDEDEESTAIADLRAFYALRLLEACPRHQADLWEVLGVATPHQFFRVFSNILRRLKEHLDDSVRGAGSSSSGGGSMGDGAFSGGSSGSAFSPPPPPSAQLCEMVLRVARQRGLLRQLERGRASELAQAL